MPRTAFQTGERQTILPNSPMVTNGILNSINESGLFLNEVNAQLRRDSDIARSAFFDQVNGFMQFDLSEERREFLSRFMRIQQPGLDDNNSSEEIRLSFESQRLSYLVAQSHGRLASGQFQSIQASSASYQQQLQNRITYLRNNRTSDINGNFGNYLVEDTSIDGRGGRYNAGVINEVGGQFAVGVEVYDFSGGVQEPLSARPLSISITGNRIINQVSEDVVGTQKEFIFLNERAAISRGSLVDA